MSSSGEWPDWGVFAERETLPDRGMLSPAAEVAAVLQQCRAAIDAAEQGTARERARWLEVLAEQAVFTIRFEEALGLFGEDLAKAGLAKTHRYLRVLKDQMLEALRQAGLAIIVPAGRPFDEVVDQVHVDGWRHDPRFAGEVVDRVVEPIVLVDGALVRMGRVVMGAPPEPGPEAAAAEGEPQAVTEAEERSDDGCRS